MRSCSLLLLSSLLLGACSAELEVQGDQQRLIGERVTLALLEGDELFSKDVELYSGGQAFSGEALAVTLDTTERELSFRIPRGAAAGPALAKIKKKDQEASYYEVDLTISRLGIVLDAKGSLESLALPPSTVQPSTATVGQTGEGLALSPSGDLLVSLGSDKVTFWAPGKELKSVGSLSFVNTRCVAAFDGGVGVGTATSVQLYNFAVGSSSTSKGSYPLNNTVALRISSDGDRAVALAHCDTDNDTKPDSDCLRAIDFATAAGKTRYQVTLDSDVGATLLAASEDGKQAIVADKNVVRGFDFSTTPPTETTYTWAGATPTAIARTLTVVKDSETELYAVADGTSKTIRTFAFEGARLRETQGRAKLDVVPQQMAFGHGRDLYVLSNKKFLKVDAGLTDSPGEPLSLNTSVTPIAFVAQP